MSGRALATRLPPVTSLKQRAAMAFGSSFGGVPPNVWIETIFTSVPPSRSSSDPLYPVQAAVRKNTVLLPCLNSSGAIVPASHQRTLEIDVTEFEAFVPSETPREEQSSGTSTTVIEDVAKLCVCRNR